MLESIFQQFDTCANQFCESTKGLYCEISSEYKGQEKPQYLKYRFAKIYYNSLVLKFTYTAHGIMSMVNSSLSCTVSFDKSEAAVVIPLQLMTDYCGMTFAAPMCVPFITNGKGMIQAFGCIESVLEKSLDKIMEISYDPEKKNALLKAFADEMKYIFNADATPEMSVFFADYFTMRFCCDAFINHINGNRAKAAKQLSKVKKITGYEKRMIALWRSDVELDMPDISALMGVAQSYNDKGVPKANFKEFLSILLPWFVMAPVLSLPYLAIFFLLVLIEGRESVYLMGPDYNFPYCIMFGFLTAIAASYFTRLKAFRLLFKKDYESYREMDYIQNGGGADKFMKGFLAVIVAVCIAGCVLCANWNLNFMSDGFEDNSEFFSLKGTYYDYEQVERVFYRPDRVNGLGETLDMPSYVLVLQDGTEIDLYEHGEITDYEETLLELFRSKGIAVETPGA